MVMEILIFAKICPFDEINALLLFTFWFDFLDVLVRIPSAVHWREEEGGGRDGWMGSP